MDNNKILGKFKNDTIQIEQKLINLRDINKSLDGCSYRNLSKLYYDTITNIEMYCKVSNLIEFESFYETRITFVEQELIELELITKMALEKDEFRQYKYFNQSYQDLVRTLDYLEYLHTRYKEENEYNYLLNFKNEEAIISKDLLLSIIDNRLHYEAANIISVDCLRNDNTAIILYINDRNKQIVVSKIENIDLKNSHDKIKGICDRYNIEKIIISEDRFNNGWLIDSISLDINLNGKLRVVNRFKNENIEPILMIKDYFSNGKIAIINPMNPSNNGKRINKEILFLLNEIQVIRFIENKNNKISVRPINMEMIRKFPVCRFMCLYNYFRTLIEKQ